MNPIFYIVLPFVAFMLVTALLNKAEEKMEEQHAGRTAKKEAADRTVDEEQTVARAIERGAEGDTSPRPAQPHALSRRGLPPELEDEEDEPLTQLVPPEFEMRDMASRLVDERAASS